MKVDSQLHLLHFQITPRCNLACPFCGQWGAHGFNRKKSAIEELPAETWLGAATRLKEDCLNKNVPLPSIILWGGEPLLHKEFDLIAGGLAGMGFRLGVVTNGMLLKEKSAIINKYVKVLFVSIDAFGEEHDRIRNKAGLFNKIEEGLRLIDPGIRKSALCVITGQNRRLLPELPLKLENLNLDNIIIQNLIFTTEDDAGKYKDWLSTEFCQDAPNVSSWINSDWKDYIEELPGIIKKMKENISNGLYRLNTCILPEEENPENVRDWYESEAGIMPAKNHTGHCLAPFRHLQVLADGRITPCVDFNDFCAGNILFDDIASIWNGSLMDKFREGVCNGRNPLCVHCPWRYNSLFSI